MNKTAIIIGASSGVGKALAYELSEKKYDLVISSRDARTLNAIKADIETCYNTNVSVIPIDLGNSKLDPKSYMKACLEILGDITSLYITAGVSVDEDSGINIRTDIDKIIAINYQSIVHLLNEFAAVFIEQEAGGIVVVSSIAAHAPRTNNIVYGSAKKGLEHYCEGLRHFLAKYNVSVSIIVLGYADTALAYGKKLLLPKASPESIAKFMILSSDKSKGISFYPKYWRIIVSVLKNLPWMIYKKLNF